MTLFGFHNSSMQLGLAFWYGKTIGKGTVPYENLAA